MNGYEQDSINDSESRSVERLVGVLVLVGLVVGVVLLVWWCRRWRCGADEGRVISRPPMQPHPMPSSVPAAVAPAPTVMVQFPTQPAYACQQPLLQPQPLAAAPINGCVSGGRAAMGGGGVARGPRRPSDVAYYVALVAIVGLLLLLCLYFFYYFIRKVNELRQMESLSPTPAPAPCRPPPCTAYPVQPVVRDSASAMAKLCKQLPSQPAGKGGTIFPASTSPAAQQTDTGEDETIAMPDKIPLTVPAITSAVAVAR